MQLTHQIKLNIPKWASTVYIGMAVVLVPWTIFLAYTLPTRHINRHWGLSWVGLDIGIMVSLLLTGLFVKLNSHLVSLAASTTASLLLIDAWFDILSSRPGRELDEAIVLAIFVEIPMAIISYMFAYRAQTAKKR